MLPKIIILDITIRGNLWLKYTRFHTVQNTMKKKTQFPTEVENGASIKRITTVRPKADLVVATINAPNWLWVVIAILWGVTRSTKSAIINDFYPEILLTTRLARRVSSVTYIYGWLAVSWDVLELGLGLGLGLVRSGPRRTRVRRF